MANMLKGLNVIELAEGVAGPAAGRLLVRHGARVIKVETPAGDPARALAPRKAGAPGETPGGLFAWLNAGKQSVVLDPADPGEAEQIRRLIDGADVVLDSALYTAREAEGLDPGTLHGRNERLIHAALTWYGQTGPYRAFPGSDGVCFGLSGYTFGLGLPGQAPSLPSGYMPQLLAGAMGAFAIVSALHGRASHAKTGGALDIDLSVLEALTVLSEGGGVFRSYDPSIVDVGRLGINRFYPTFPLGVYPARDGWVGLTALTPPQWMGLCDMLGLPALAARDAFQVSVNRLMANEEIDAALKPKMAEWSVRDLVKEGQSRRIPMVIVPTAEEALALSEFRNRPAFETIDARGLGRFDAPRRPYLFTGREETRVWRLPEKGADQTLAESAPGSVSAKGAGGHRPADLLPLEGMRVLDLSMGWAGPLATRYLGELGADIIKVEAIQRPDWMRGYEPTEAWRDGLEYEKNYSFNTYSQGKRGITLDITEAEGQSLLKRLVRHANALIESNAGGVIERLGLGYETLARERPDLVMLSMPAYGVDSPWTAYRAYGSTVEQAAGLPHVNGEADWPPTQTHVALGDAVAGIHASLALALALWQQRQTGEGQFIDLAQVECLLTLGAHGIIAQALNGEPWPRLGARHRDHAPHGVFACKGEEDWLAVTVIEDAQWPALARAIGRADLAEDAGLATASGRKAREAELEAALADWTATRSASEAMATLMEAGAPAGVVRSALDLMADPQIEARGLFRMASRPHVGEKPLPAPAFFLGGERLPVRRTAPLLGEHNHEVFSELLGLSPDEIADLETRGIIGSRPLLPHEVAERRARASSA